MVKGAPTCEEFTQPPSHPDAQLCPVLDANVPFSQVQGEFRIDVFVPRSSSSSNEQVMAWVTLCRGNLPCARQPSRYTVMKSSPTFTRCFRPNQNGGVTTDRRQSFLRLHKRAERRRTKASHSKTRSDRPPSGEASTPLLEHTWYRRRQPRASQTERHSEWLHEKKGGCNRTRNKFHTSTDRCLTNNKKRPSKVISLLRNEGFLEEDGACFQHPAGLES